MEPQTTNESLERDDDALNTKEAARFLGTSVSRLARLRVTGGGCVFVKDGASVRYLKSDLREYRDARKKTSTTGSRSKRAVPREAPTPAPAL